MNNQTPQKPLKNSVPVTLASVQTANWRSYMTELVEDPADEIKGYFIPIDDLNDVMRYAVNGVRVYFALPEKGEEVDVRGVHLYVVAVDGDGNDLLTNVEEESIIYDTTVPCPAMCGAPNSLNGYQ